MNFIFKKEHGEVDAWVANLNESEMEAAIGEAALAAKKLAQRKEQEEKKSEKRPRRTIGELKEELLAIMQPGESISSTMRRLSGKTGVLQSFYMIFIHNYNHHRQFSFYLLTTDNHFLSFVQPYLLIN